jgi:hypothetical protein
VGFTQGAPFAGYVESVSPHKDVTTGLYKAVLKLTKPADKKNGDITAVYAAVKALKGILAIQKRAVLHYR